MNTTQTKKEEYPSDFKPEYAPCDPDANEESYVELPNVNLVKEITDGMVSSSGSGLNLG